MAGEVLIVGLSTGPVWGCPDQTWGKGQSFDHTKESSTKTLADGNGNTVAVAYYDAKESVSYTVKIAGTPPTFSPGMTLTVDGTARLLKSAKLTKKNDDFAEYQLELESYELITPTPAGE